MSGDYTPELGQMVFGTAWGCFDAGDLGYACVRHALQEVGRVFHNVHQRAWDEAEDPEIPGLVFHPYYWGDCTCGYDEAGAAWSEAHAHAPTCYQTEYHRAVDLRMDSKKRDRIARQICAKHGIPWNDGYGSAVHCDCSHDAEWATWRAEHDHTADCPIVAPNLAVGDGVEIRWYKHPGRGLTVNRDLTADEWRAWLNRVCAIVRAADVKLP